MSISILHICIHRHKDNNISSHIVLRIRLDGIIHVKHLAKGLVNSRYSTNFESCYDYSKPASYHPQDYRGKPQHAEVRYRYHEITFTMKPVQNVKYSILKYSIIFTPLKIIEI